MNKLNLAVQQFAGFLRLRFASRTYERHRTNRDVLWYFYHFQSMPQMGVNCEAVVTMTAWVRTPIQAFILLPQVVKFSTMPRELVWMTQPRFLGWGCSQCAWVFNPSGPPTGETFDAMVQNYERRRDDEFASHICTQHPRQPKETPDEKLRGPLDGPSRR